MKYYLAISDTQSDLEHLEALLENIKGTCEIYDPHIVFLGDYFDRGNKPFDKLVLMLDLADKFETTFLDGNHESMLRMALDPLNDGNRNVNILLTNNGVFKTLEGIARGLNKVYKREHGRDILAALGGYNIPNFRAICKQSKYFLEWLNNMPSILENDKLIFSHAPLLFEQDYHEYSNWANHNSDIRLNALNFEEKNIFDESWLKEIDKINVCGHVHSYVTYPRFYPNHHYLDTTSQPITAVLYSEDGNIIEIINSNGDHTIEND